MTDAPQLDRFGNRIDPEVGYARGAILRDSRTELLRLARARALMRDRIQRHGTDALFTFTGTEARTRVHEIGAEAGTDELEQRAARLLGAPDGDRIALFTRTTAGIIAATLAHLGRAQTLVSLVPAGSSHPSVARAARLSAARLVECQHIDEFAAALHSTTGDLAVITGVTSELVVMAEETLARAIQACRAAGRTCLVDDAYGALVRTVLLSQRPARALGADLVIMSAQKAGLGGARMGIMTGAAAAVERALAAAAELGVEASADVPRTLAALRAFTPDDVVAMSRAGEALYQAIRAVLGPERVTPTLLGPVVKTDDILTIALERGGANQAGCVPAEAGAALGMLLLEKHGIVTVNALGSPGARMSLRLKCTPQTLLAAGGAEAVAAATDDAFHQLGRDVSDAEAVRSLLVGGPGIHAGPPSDRSRSV